MGCLDGMLSGCEYGANAMNMGFPAENGRVGRLAFNHSLLCSSFIHGNSGLDAAATAAASAGGLGRSSSCGSFLHSVSSSFCECSAMPNEPCKPYPLTKCNNHLPSCGDSESAAEMRTGVDCFLRFLQVSTRVFDRHRFTGRGASKSASPPAESSATAV